MRRKDHQDTRSSNSTASREQIECDTLAQKQVSGLSAYSRDVLYGFELVALRDVPFDTVARDDDVSSWASVTYMASSRAPTCSLGGGISRRRRGCPRGRRVSSPFPKETPREEPPRRRSRHNRKRVCPHRARRIHGSSRRVGVDEKTGESSITGRLVANENYGMLRLLVCRYRDGPAFPDSARTV